MGDLVISSLVDRADRSRCDAEFSGQVSSFFTHRSTRPDLFNLLCCESPTRRGSSFQLPVEASWSVDNVRPVSPSHGHLYSDCGDSEFGCEFVCPFTICVAFANFDHLRLCKNGPRRSLSAKIFAAFSKRIELVHRIVSDEQVPRIHARWIVAMVASHHPVGNDNADEFESEMRGDNRSRSIPKQAVAFWVSLRDPWPTLVIVSSIDSTPKPCDDLLVHGTRNSCEPGPGRVVATRGRFDRSVA
jgi:hypothetical protein